MIGQELYSDCCLRRFNNSRRCSSSKTNSLLRSLMIEVFDERRVRFNEDDEEEDRIARKDNQ